MNRLDVVVVVQIIVVVHIDFDGVCSFINNTYLQVQQLLVIAGL